MGGRKKSSAGNTGEKAMAQKHGYQLGLPIKVFVEYVTGKLHLKYRQNTHLKYLHISAG